MRVGRWKTSFAIPLVITHDLIDEQDKTIILTLTGWDGVGYDLGATRIHTLTIKDIQNKEITKPIVSFASLELTVNEAVGTHGAKVSLHPAPTTNISLGYEVSGPATVRADYTKLSSSVVLRAIRR